MTSSSIPQKRCTKCGEEKPDTPEYFGKCGFGLHQRCKLCAREYHRQHRAKNVEQLREYYRQYRESNAEQLREYHREYYEANIEKIRESEHRRRAENIEQFREYSRQYYEVNADRIRENVRRYRRENPDKAREAIKRWRLANPERVRGYHRVWRVNNPDKAHESTRRWSQANPEKIRAKQHRRRALKLSLPATFTAEHERHALDYFNGCCAVCGRQLKDLFRTHTVHFDHWIPLSKGGGSTPDNTVPLCGGQGGCNNSKGANDPLEWLVYKFGTAKAKKILARIQVYFDSLEV